jgi:hypothetical protein
MFLGKVMIPVNVKVEMSDVVKKLKILIGFAVLVHVLGEVMIPVNVKVEMSDVKKKLKYL